MNQLNELNLIYIRNKKKQEVEIQLINFFDFLKNNEQAGRSVLNKPKADFMLKEYENGSYQGLSDELRLKISKMDLEEEDLCKRR